MILSTARNRLTREKRSGASFKSLIFVENEKLFAKTIIPTEPIIMKKYEIRINSFTIYPLKMELVTIRFRSIYNPG